MSISINRPLVVYSEFTLKVYLNQLKSRDIYSKNIIEMLRLSCMARNHDGAIKCYIEPYLGFSDILQRFFEMT